MILSLLYWFSAMLGQSASKCMHESFQHCYHHQCLKAQIDEFACDECQWTKTSCPGHGLIPDRDIIGTPCEKVAVDVIRPWSRPKWHCEIELFALICIDNTNNLIEIVHIFKNLATMLL